MYVCICNAISDREIRGAIALGARTFSDLQCTLGVATCCRACTDCVKAIVDEHASVSANVVAAQLTPQLTPQLATQLTTRPAADAAGEPLDVRVECSAPGDD